jgi:hypothetical protein
MNLRSPWFRLLPLAVALATTTPLRAQELADPTLIQLNDLVSRGRYEEAYNLSIENLEE